MKDRLTSLQNPIVKHLSHLRQNRDYRDDNKSVLIEGRKIISEVCPFHHTKLIMAYDISFIPPGVEADEILIVNEAIMRKVSGSQNPEGIIAEVDMPEAASFTGLKWIIALDGVSDPGNLGTLLRTALALGWEGAFILDNSCDAFNDKALRAAKGATFRLPIASGNWEKLKEIIKSNKLKPLAADMHGTDLGKVKVENGTLLILSHEAHGISSEASELCEHIRIPMPGEMESLNVATAGGILMYVLKQGKL
jgi:TrmH family RNA methyltransferase